MKQVTKKNLREFVLYSKNRKPRTNNGLSQKTGLSIYSVNSYISTLKRFVYYLWAEEDVLSEDLTGAIRSLRPNTFMPLLLTPVEIYSIIKCPRVWGKYHKWIDRRKYDFFFEILARCGLRRAETQNLRIQDFNFEDETFRIIGKGNKIRTVPIPNIMKTNLYLWFMERKARPEDWVFMGTRGGKEARLASTPTKPS